jgi:hypothetical protein
MQFHRYSRVLGVLHVLFGKPVPTFPEHALARSSATPPGRANAGDGCSRVGVRSETLISVELGLLVRTRSQDQFVLRQLDPVLFNDSFQTCDVL